MSKLTHSITITLPAWLSAYSSNNCTINNTIEQMEFVIEMAKQNVLNKTGGPFAAAVFEQNSGRLISLGVNQVTTQKLSVLHAEVMALSFAQHTRQSYSLSQQNMESCRLVTSSEPCAMCLGAICWAGINELICGASAEQARAIGFDEGPITDNWQQSLQVRGITVTTGVCSDAANQNLVYYRDHAGTIYNA